MWTICNLKNVSSLFLQRLIATIRVGQRLDDPHDPEILHRWSMIAVDVPDKALMRVVPTALRGLLRREDAIARTLVERCGVRPGAPMQHEAIAPLVIGRRRALRASGDAEHANIALRAGIHHAREQLNIMFDQATRLEAERETLAASNAQLQLSCLAAKRRAVEAERRLSAAQERALRLFQSYLLRLREDNVRLPERPMMAAMVVKVCAAILEACGSAIDVRAAALPPEIDNGTREAVLLAVAADNGTAVSAGDDQRYYALRQ